MENKYDLIVIGAGPGGYHTAIHAAKKGLKTAVIEKHKVGGTCLNYGCMPTKIMLDAAVRLRERLPYVSTSVDAASLFAHRDGAIAMLRGGVEGLLRRNGVDLVEGIGRFDGIGSLEVTPPDNACFTVGFDHCIIATGSAPAGLPLLDPVSEYVINSDSATGMTEIPGSVCIIGGGVIGIEFAYIYNALGADVTVVEILDRILINEDPMVSEYITDLLKKAGIEIITGKRITEVRPEGDVAAIVAEEREIAAERILCAVGRRPCADDLGLDSLGVGMLTEKGAIAVDGGFETPCKGIYAVGDVNGLVMLAHAASAQGCRVVDHIVDGKAADWDPALVPKCVYIEPEIASVGLTEEQASEVTGCRTALYPFAANGKAIALGKTEGFVKVVADGDGRLLGMTIVGDKATELIAAATELIALRRTVHDAEDLIFAHPTFSETVQEAILQIDGMAVHA